eukprot:9321822-Ditylum_brightwellii.AAC.1
MVGAGQFIPYGIHLTDGPATYKNILQGQKIFIKEHTGIVIEGLLEKGLLRKMTMKDGSTKSLEDYIIHELDAEAME